MENLFNTTKEEKLNLEDIVVILSYIFFAIFLFLGLIGLFNRLTVLLFIIVAVSIIFYFREKITFNKKFLWLFLIVAIIVAGFGYLRGFTPGDCYDTWLPAAKLTAQNHTFPDFLTDSYFSRPPLQVMFYAATFLTFNKINEFILFWVPFFFTTATLILLYKWASNKNLDKKLLFFLPLVFLTSPEVVSFAGWSLLQESVLLFFSTCVFYYYERYLENRQKLYLIMIILSLALAAASKESGIFLLFFLVPIIFLKSPRKKNFLFYAVLIFVPILVWLVRNYLIFENPVIPLLADFFPGKYSEMLSQSTYYTPTPDYLRSLSAKYLFTLKYLFTAIPFIFLSLYGFLKNKRYEYLFILIVFFLVKEYVFFSVTSVIRYYYIFFGLLLIYGLVGLDKLKSKLALAGLSVFTVWNLFQIPINDSASDFISTIESKFQLLKNIFVFINHYQVFVLAIIFFIILFNAKHKSKIILLMFFCLQFLQVKYIVNKSWLNTWLVLVLMIFFIILLVFKFKFENYKKYFVATIIFIMILETWGMGSIYYWRHGFSWPAAYVSQEPKWVSQVLAAENFNKKENYVLVDSQAAYLEWHHNYLAVTFGKFNFNVMTNLEYKDILTIAEIKDLFIRYKFKYLVYNGEENLRFNKFYDKLIKDNPFEVIAENKKGYQVMRVY